MFCKYVNFFLIITSPVPIRFLIGGTWAIVFSSLPRFSATIRFQVYEDLLIDDCLICVISVVNCLVEFFFYKMPL